MHDNNILFIDASQHFDKVGNQNTLTDEHVEKIITTYQAREAIDKYAYVASLDEVKENDYNLNIPRYVDTFEEEEPVDMDAVVKDLRTLEVGHAGNGQNHCRVLQGTGDRKSVLIQEFLNDCNTTKYTGFTVSRVS